MTVLRGTKADGNQYTTLTRTGDGALGFAEDIKAAAAADGDGNNSLQDWLDHHISEIEAAMQAGMTNAEAIAALRALIPAFTSADDRDKLLNVRESGDVLTLTAPSTVVRAALGTRYPPQPSAAVAGKPVIGNAAGDALVFSDEDFVTPEGLRTRGPQDQTYAGGVADRIEVWERSSGTDQTTDAWASDDLKAATQAAVDAIRFDGSRNVTISFEADLFRRKDQGGTTSGAVLIGALELIATDGTTSRVLPGEFYFARSTIAEYNAARDANGQGVYGSNPDATDHVLWTSTNPGSWNLAQNEYLAVRLRIQNQNGFASLRVRIRNFRLRVAASGLFLPPRWHRIMLEDFRLPRANFGHVFNAKVPDDTNGNDVWLVKFSVPSGGSALIDEQWVIQASQIANPTGEQLDFNPYTVGPDEGFVTRVVERKAEFTSHGLFVTSDTTPGNDLGKFVLSASTNFGDNAFCRLEILRLR